MRRTLEFRTPLVNVNYLPAHLLEVIDGSTPARTITPEERWWTTNAYIPPDAWTQQREKVVRTVYRWDIKPNWFRKLMKLVKGLR